MSATDSRWTPEHGWQDVVTIPVALLAEIVADLRRGACAFWACPGPDVPYVPMVTCHRCYGVRRLTALLSPMSGDGTGDNC